MRGPGVPRGVRLSQPVANIDLAATIVDAADARPARSLDGRSLLGLARDPAVEWGRDILLENGPAGSRPNVYKAVRTRRYVYARYGNGEQELYDLARDPHQLQSRHADPAMRRVRSSLSARLNRLSGCRGSRCRTRPRLALRLSYRRGRTGAGRTCAAGRVRAEVRGTDRRSVETVRFHVQGRRAATDGRSPFRASLRLGRVARGDFATIRARATVRYDRLLTLDRRVRRC
jgi:hypothetical protein